MHDRAGLFRPDLRGPRPATHGLTRSPTPWPSSAARPQVEFDHVDFRYPARRGGVSGLARGGGDPRGAIGQQVLNDVSFVAEARRTGRAGRARPAPARPPSANLVPPPLRRDRRAVLINGVDVRDVTMDSLHDAIGRGDPGRPPVPRHDPRQPAVRQAGRDRSGDRRAFARPRSSARGAALPTASNRGRRPRLTGCPVARNSAWRSPRPLLEGAGHRGPGRGHRPPGLRIRGWPSSRRSRRSWPDVRPSSSPTGFHGARGGPDPGDHRGRIIERGRHADLLATGGFYADLYKTQFAHQVEVQDEDEPVDDDDGDQPTGTRFW